MTTTATTGPSPNLLDYLIGECTRGVAEAVNWIGAGWGDAANWAGAAARGGFAVTHKPTLGSVFDLGPYAGYANSAAGHVAEVVGFASNGLPIVQEENGAFGVGTFDLRELSQSDINAGSFIQSPETPEWTPLTDSALQGHGPDQPLREGSLMSTPYVAGSGTTITGTGTGGPNLDLNPLDLPGETAGWLTGAITQPIVNALGQAVGQTVANAAGGVGNFFGVGATDVGTFMRNNLVPFIVAGVVLVVLMG